MKYKIIYLFSLLLLLSACKSTKNITSVRMLSSKKVIKKHYKASFSKKTVQAKLKLRYTSEKMSKTIRLKLRIKKDEVIWMSATFLGIPIARLKITPNSVQYYEKIQQTYFDGDFSIINKTLGANLNFKHLQNLLLGEAIYDLSLKKHKIKIDKHAHLLTPKKQDDLMAIFFWINPTHYKLTQQKIEVEQPKGSLEISYPTYQKITDTYFPKKIHILASSKKQTTKLDLDFKTVVFDTDFRTPFSIPEGYTELKF